MATERLDFELKSLMPPTEPSRAWFQQHGAA